MKPCPFCHKDGFLTGETYYRDSLDAKEESVYWVECSGSGCEARGPVTGSEHMAEWGWDRRFDTEGNFIP